MARDNNPYRKSIAVLTGVRGFAVLLVLLSHASNRGLSFHPVLSFSGAGRYGVFLFFVLSSFLLTSQFLQSGEWLGAQWKFILRYAKRRFFRIYPLFFISLSVYLLLHTLGRGIYNLDPAGMIRSLLLLEGKGIFWTIPVEFQYYIILPAIGWCLKRYENSGKLIVLLPAAGLLWQQFIPPVYVANLLPFLPVFLFGSACALLHHNLVRGKVSLPFTDSGAVKGADIMAACCFILFFLFIPAMFNMVWKSRLAADAFHLYFLPWATLCCLFLLSLLHGDGHVRKMLENRFFLFWGRVSFSAYLWHMILLETAAHLRLPSPLALLFFLLSTAIVSYLSHKFIEQPFLETDRPPVSP